MALAIILITGAFTSAAAQNVAVRKNASTDAAKDDLAALNTAMGIMKKLDSTDTTSWAYQAGIHWVPSNAEGANLSGGAPWCPTYDGTTNTLKTAWDNCTHSPSRPRAHFLVWHRLYIYYLENIVRAKSGKKDFALPYWNYVDPTTRVMPAIFQDKTTHLYVAARCTTLNANQPVSSEMDSLLNVTDLMKKRSYAFFNSAIDAAPHGAMHNYIGGSSDGETFHNDIYNAKNNGLMANVPSAAFDPIFWLHHAEIDFLWQQWMTQHKGPQPKESDLAEMSYTFFDTDGSKIVFNTAQALQKAFSLPVTYDVYATKNQLQLAQVKPVSNDNPAALKVQKPAPANIVASLAAPQAIKGKATSFKAKLKTNAPEGTFAPKDVDTSLTTVLHVKVSFAKAPSGIYEIFVRNDEAKKLDTMGQRAGVLSFFGAEHHLEGDHGAEHGDAHGAGDKKVTLDFQYDITEKINSKTFDGNLEFLIKKVGDKADKDAITIEETKIEVRK